MDMDSNRRYKIKAGFRDEYTENATLFYSAQDIKSFFKRSSSIKTIAGFLESLYSLHKTDTPQKNDNGHILYLEDKQSILEAKAVCLQRLKIQSKLTPEAIELFTKFILRGNGLGYEETVHKRIKLIRRYERLYLYQSISIFHAALGCSTPHLVLQILPYKNWIQKHQIEKKFLKNIRIRLKSHNKPRFRPPVYSTAPFFPQEPLHLALLPENPGGTRLKEVLMPVSMFDQFLSEQ